MKLYENGFKLIEQGDTEKLYQKIKQTMKDKLNEVQKMIFYVFPLLHVIFYIFLLLHVIFYGKYLNLC